MGRGKVIRLRGDAVYCLRRFHDLVADLVRAAWVRFIRELPRNRPLLGESRDLSDFLFGSDRSVLAPFRELLLDFQAGRCFYCEQPIREVTPAVDHFIPWSRYPMDLGENLVVADEKCNSWKSDMLAATCHLARWRRRNAAVQTGKAFAAASLPHDGAVVERVAFWAYSQAEKIRAQVWVQGRDELAPLEAGWRRTPSLGPRQLGATETGRPPRAFSSASPTSTGTSSSRRNGPLLTCASPRLSFVSAIRGALIFEVEGA